MKYLNELKTLNLLKNKFAIFGSGPLAIRGLRKNRDIDLIVKPDLWNKLIKKYPVENKKRKHIKIKHIEIFKDWRPCFNNTSKLIDDSDITRGFRFVKLKYLLKWKRARNKEKDKMDIRLINKYIKSRT